MFFLEVRLHDGESQRRFPRDGLLEGFGDEQRDVVEPILDASRRHEHLLQTLERRAGEIQRTSEDILAGKADFFEPIGDLKSGAETRHAVHGRHDGLFDDFTRDDAVQRHR